MKCERDCLSEAVRAITSEWVKVKDIKINTYYLMRQFVRDVAISSQTVAYIEHGPIELIKVTDKAIQPNEHMANVYIAHFETLRIHQPYRFYDPGYETSSIVCFVHALYKLPALEDLIYNTPKKEEI